MHLETTNREAHRNAVWGALDALRAKYGNSVTGFYDALCVYGVEEVAKALPQMLRSAKFWKWHENKADTCRTFCNICAVDSMLVESYLGTRFDDIFKEEIL
jgi:hypothetical protein